MNEQISLGTCPTCGGPAQFIEGGQVRHVDLRTAGTGPSELNALADSWRSRYDNASSSDDLPTGHDCADELDAVAERMGDGELARLERELAEEFAQSIVECHGCPEFVNGERSGWLQCPKDEDEASIFTSSARYLDLRGLLERHPEHPDWVRVKEQ